MFIVLPQMNGMALFSGFPLCRCTTGAVVVDKTTHQPCVHPEEFRNKFKHIKPTIIVERFR